MDFQPNNSLYKRIWLSSGKFILITLPIFAFILIPAVTHAGVLSFLSSLFSGQSVSAQTETIIQTGSSTTYEPVVPANNINPSPKENASPTIEGGEALLSEVGPLNSAPEAVDNSAGQISVYIVRAGDTLAKIASMFDVSVNTIVWANDLTRSSALKAGQTLVILPITGVMHTVVAKDTLQSIAKKYGGDINEITIYNDLALTDILTVGDTIVIPDGEVSYSTRPVTGTTSRTTERLIVSAGGPEYPGYYIQPFFNGHKTQGLHGYNAVDYGMPSGSPLYAAAAGIVIISRNSGYNGGYGDYVAIQHLNNSQTVYGHMSNPVVVVGQRVTQGQLIGYSGNTGKSTGAHLHLEVRGAKNPF